MHLLTCRTALAGVIGAAMALVVGGGGARATDYKEALAR
jgi:hypothetical protein